MTTLRCWARRAHGEAICDRPTGHDPGSRGYHMQLRALGHEPHWHDSDCAPDAGPDGRETAALRILELSHEQDRRCFLFGEMSQLAPKLRAIAARLMVDDRAAPRDLETLIQELDSDRRGKIVKGSGNQELLSLAADILRAFAEGR